MKKKNTYHIITFGCQMNKSDSERIAGYLEMHGFKNSENCEEAGLAIINTCGVRQSAEDRAYGLITKIKKDNSKAKIILTGCLSERDDVIKKIKDRVDIWLPIRELPVLSKKLKARSKKLWDDYLKIMPEYGSKISAFVPIGKGCDNFCAYCVVPYARGREVYRDVQEILNEVRGLVNKGYKEINLIAQNVNSYKSQILNPKNQINFKSQKPNKDNLINFSKLLRMVNDIPGEFWIRFATSHPKDMSDKLIKAIKECDKVCEHVHLPVQAGDDEVLRRMNRKYTVADYKKLISKIRKTIPDVSITTDVIVGFPGESEDQFNNTVKLFNEAKFDLAYIAQYSPRPGTAAAKLDNNITKAEKKRREKVLTEVLSKTALVNNKKYLGKSVEVLIEGKNRKGEWFGRTRSNKNIIVKSIKYKVKSSIKGKFLKVKIEKIKDFGLEGVIGPRSNKSYSNVPHS